MQLKNYQEKCNRRHKKSAIMTYKRQTGRNLTTGRKRDKLIMSTKTLPLTEVRDHFTSVLRDVSRFYDRCVITKKGKPEAVLMNYVDARKDVY